MAVIIIIIFIIFITKVITIIIITIMNMILILSINAYCRIPNKSCGLIIIITLIIDLFNLN